MRNANGHGRAFFYDPTYRVFPTLVTNSLMQTELEIEWDPALAFQTKITVGNASPLVLVPDSLGRLKQATLPQGGVLEREYVSWGDATRQYVLDRLIDGSADGLWTRTYLDGLGRTYLETRKSAVRNEIFERLTQFGDASRLVYRVSDWFRTGRTGSTRYQVC